MEPQNFTPLVTKLTNGRKPRFPRRLFVVLGLLFFLIVIGVNAYLAINQKKNRSEVITVPSQSVRPTLSPTLIPTITIAPLVYSPTPTQKIVATNTPSPFLPTNTPVPTIPPPTSIPQPTSTPQPTPTRTPNPPRIEITYPSENQFIEMNSSQTFCVVDVPVGGDTSSIKRKHSINDGSWTSYTDIFTLCFSPNEGTNRFQLQYINKYGEESPVYTRQFNFHRL